VQANAACIGVGLDTDHIIIERDQFGRRIPELKVGHIPASSTAAEDEVREAAAAAEATAAAAGKKPKKQKKKVPPRRTFSKVKVMREDIPLPSSRKFNPTAEELREAITEKLQASDAFAHLHQLQLEIILKASLKGKDGAPDTPFQLIFTPPYFPKSQPIEELWACCKNKVADQWHVGRTLEQARDQLLNSFYGGTDVRHTLSQILPPSQQQIPAFGAQACQDRIRHSHVFLNRQIGLVGGLSGTIDALVHSSSAFIFNVFSDDEEEDDFSDDELSYEG